MLALTAESLDDVVKDEMRESWPNIKKRWFADHTPESQKTPGLLKEEFQSNDGFFIGLSSKCYIATSGEHIKRSQKGTPKYLGMPLQKFQNCLFLNQIPKATYSTIMPDNRLASCVTKTVTKKALNAIYYKHFVADNSVDISPFKVNNQYL